MRWATGLLLAGFVAGGIAACTGGDDKPEVKPPSANVKPPSTREAGDPNKIDPKEGGPQVPVKVAILLPLSGPYEAVGKAMQKAAEMAVFETGGSNFTLVPIDTQGTAAGAAAAADQAIGQGVKLILGPLFSSSVSAVREKAAAANINVIAFSNDRSVAGGNVFLISFQPKPEVERIIAYAAAQGVRRIAVLVPSNEYGRSVIQYARDIATKHNVSITRTGTYNANSMDVGKDIQAFADVVEVNRKGKAIRRSPIDFDAVLIADGGAKLRLIASLLNYYDVDPDKIHFLGTGRWDDPSIRSEPSLKGGWFAAPAPELRERFIAKYRAAHKETPPRTASLAYDAVALAATLARGASSADQQVFTTESITSPSGFLGADGLFRFGSDGTAERGLAVMEVTPDEFRTISDAPRSFAGTTTSN
jgi:branched-chain amino acid transport system substrate-binding protein